MSKNCSDGHCWQPIVSPTQPSRAWFWRCVDCNLTVSSKPNGIPGYISLKDLEAMVDSSLRLSDYVIVDDQSVKGELWIMRNSHWVYVPLEFQILYHVFGGDPFVVLFRYKEAGVWRNVIDTALYKVLLMRADELRAKLDPKLYIT